MTPGQALGMLFVGVVALSLGGAIAFLILRKVYRSYINLKEGLMT